MACQYAQCSGFRCGVNFFVAGGLIHAIGMQFWWLEDFIMDLWEQYTMEDDEFYTSEKK